MQSREEGQSPGCFILILVMAMPDAIKPRLVAQKNAFSLFSHIFPKPSMLQRPALEFEWLALVLCEGDSHTAERPALPGFE